MKWLDGSRIRRLEKLALSKTELAIFEQALEQATETLLTSKQKDPILACKNSPLLQCDIIQRMVYSCLKLGVGAESSAIGLCKALHELCGLSLEGGWIREESSHWADRDPAAHALYNDMPKLALMLIEKGASVDAQLHDGEPLVVWFAKSAGNHLLEFLDKEPDLNARGRAGGTFLHHLSWLDKFEGEQPSGLYKRAVSKAKSRGMDINVRDHEGRTPLHWAAQMGDYALAQALIEAGADPLAVSSGGQTPWEEAGSDRVAHYLEAAALAAREAYELGELGGERARLAGNTVLELIEYGLISVNGKTARNLTDLLDAYSKLDKKDTDKKGSKRL